MKSRIRTHKKSTREQKPDFSTASAQPMFQSRPFVVQQKTEETSQPQPELKTSLMRAQRYGHHLSKMQPTEVSSATVVQPKREMGYSPESDRANAPPVIQAARFKLSNFLGRKKGQAPPPAMPTPAPATPAPLPTRPDWTNLAGGFQPGDKLYGLAHARPQGDVTAAGTNQGKATVIDELNNQFLGTKGVGYTSKTMGPIVKQNPATPGADAWKQGAAYGRENIPAKTPEQKQEALEYQQWLEKHPKYSPTNTQVRNEPLSSPFRQWDRTKKSSKAGIEYTAKEKGNNVHFLLDDINEEAVVKKLNHKSPHKQVEQNIDHVTGDSKRAITAAELRSVYRNRFDPAYKNNVVFWHNGKQVDAPWKTNPDLWSQYKPKSEPRNQLSPHKPIMGGGGLSGELKQENPNLLF